jgi:hypothetical protein
VLSLDLNFEGPTKLHNQCPCYNYYPYEPSTATTLATHDIERAFNNINPKVLEQIMEQQKKTNIYFLMGSGIYNR